MFLSLMLKQKDKMRSKTILLALIAVIALYISQACAEEFKEKNLIADTVAKDGHFFEILINPDNHKVVYFQDEEAHTWVDASLCPVDVGKLYAEKIALQEMQGELDSIKDETWDDRNRH
jgi:hypothetical protein